jgi:hypothetical protein
MTPTRTKEATDDRIRPVVIGDGGDLVSFVGEYHLARRPASSRS